MLRIGAMNMTLHGIDDPLTTDRDSLSEDHADQREKYTLVLANPPFKGAIDGNFTAKDLLSQSLKQKRSSFCLSV